MNPLIAKISSHATYPIHICKDISNLKSCVDSVLANKVVVICDWNIQKHWADEISKSITKRQFWFAIEPGETSKNLSVAQDIYHFLFMNQISRSDVVIAFGGGVIGDLVGFVCATYLRGIKLIHLPTSLLSQVDSSIGGKCGINHNGIKNLIGSFYQPALVYINTGFLCTLNQNEICNGLVEIIVHSLISDSQLFCYIEDNLSNVLSLNDEAMLNIINRNCKIKMDIVEQDEQEKNGTRMLLNLGHTFGHALESYHDFTIKHGYCVAYGIVFAFMMAKKLNHIHQSEIERVISLLKRIGCFINPISKFDIDEVYLLMLRDKKISDGKFTFVLPKQIGDAILFRTNDKSFVYSVLNELNEFINELSH